MEWLSKKYFIRVSPHLCLCFWLPHIQYRLSWLSCAYALPVISGWEFCFLFFTTIKLVNFNLCCVCWSVFEMSHFRALGYSTDNGERHTYPCSPLLYVNSTFTFFSELLSGRGNCKHIEAGGEIGLIVAWTKTSETLNTPRGWPLIYCVTCIWCMLNKLWPYWFNYFALNN